MSAYLMSKMVLVGLAAAWFLAASPTSRSSSVKATYEGVIRFPVRTRVSNWSRRSKAAVVPRTLVVDENLDLALLHHTDAAVCGSKVLRRCMLARSQPRKAVEEVHLQYQ